MVAAKTKKSLAAKRARHALKAIIVVEGILANQIRTHRVQHIGFSKHRCTYSF